MVAMYQKLSFSDFILFYNSRNRHLEFLNLGPQGLISSVDLRTVKLLWCKLTLTLSWHILALYINYLNFSLEKLYQNNYYKAMYLFSFWIRNRKYDFLWNLIIKTLMEVMITIRLIQLAKQANEKQILRHKNQVHNVNL